MSHKTARQCHIKKKERKNFAVIFGIDQKSSFSYRIIIRNSNY